MTAEVTVQAERLLAVGRGDKIRTYNVIDSRVVDHHLGKKTKQIKRIMKGELDLLLDKDEVPHAEKVVTRLLS